MEETDVKSSLLIQDFSCNVRGKHPNPSECARKLPVTVNLCSEAFTKQSKYQKGLQESLLAKTREREKVGIIVGGGTVGERMRFNTEQEGKADDTHESPGKFSRRKRTSGG